MTMDLGLPIYTIPIWMWCKSKDCQWKVRGAVFPSPSAQCCAGGVKPCLNLIKIHQTCKLLFHQLTPSAFECLRSVCEGWINEQERYYYFNGRHQEIEPCGRLCEWREEVGATVYAYVRACLSEGFFFCMCAWHTSARVWEFVHAYMQVCVRLYETGEGRKQKQEIEQLIKDKKGKKFMYAYWHTCESACVILRVCVPVVVFEVRRKETCISTLMLYSVGHTHIQRPKRIRNKL